MSKKGSENAINYLIKEMGSEYKSLIDTNNISDGYHTFGELYNHRCALFLVFSSVYRKSAFKTKKDNRGKEIEGWFILGIETDYGQITYHLPNSYWDSIPYIREQDKNNGYDGHTSQDVYDRLIKIIGNANDKLKDNHD